MRILFNACEIEGCNELFLKVLKQTHRHGKIAAGEQDINEMMEALGDIRVFLKLLMEKTPNGMSVIIPARFNMDKGDLSQVFVKFEIPEEDFLSLVKIMKRHIAPIVHLIRMAENLWLAFKTFGETLNEDLMTWSNKVQGK